MDPSLTDVAELINFDYSGETRSEHGPIDADEWWVMFADTRDHTTIYVKQDL